MQDLREFGSGAEYDAQFGAGYEAEIAYLTALAQKQGGAVLDLCCGTGIVAIPLAEAGLEVVGVDVARPMLDWAVEKAGGRRNPRFLHADALDLDLPERFRLAYLTGNAFQAFLSEDEIRALLRRVHRHLEPGGSLVFDTRLPEGYDLSLDREFVDAGTYLDPRGRRVRYFEKQARYDPAHGVLGIEMKRVLTDGTECHSGIDLKFTPFDQLATLVEESGFELVGVYGSWRRDPFELMGVNVMMEMMKRSSLSRRGVRPFWMP